MRQEATTLVTITLLIAAALSGFTFAGAGYCGGGPVSTMTRASALDPTEATTLTFVREEEKMARDVYLTMSGMWGLPVFSQIAVSEQAHMDAILLMLDKYGLPDPAAETGIGEFVNTDIQQLYLDLIDIGTESSVAALYVGAFIEEYDIKDLRDAIEETDNPDVAQVYSNLVAGSENHLRAFVGLIEASTGVDYQAQWLPQDTVEEILASTSSSGRKTKSGPR